MLFFCITVIICFLTEYFHWWLWLTKPCDELRPADVAARGRCIRRALPSTGQIVSFLWKVGGCLWTGQQGPLISILSHSHVNGVLQALRPTENTLWCRCEEYSHITAIRVIHTHALSLLHTHTHTAGIQKAPSADEFPSPFSLLTFSVS